MNPLHCDIHNKDFHAEPNSRGNYWHFIDKDPDGKPTFCNKPAADVTQVKYTPGMDQKASEIREKIEDKPDWDEIALGKIRHGVAIAYIEKGSVLSERIKQEINEWTDFIKSGK